MRSLEREAQRNFVPDSLGRSLSTSEILPAGKKMFLRKVEDAKCKDDLLLVSESGWASRRFDDRLVRFFVQNAREQIRDSLMLLDGRPKGGHK